MLNLDGTPYLLDSKAETAIVVQIKTLEERVVLLRSNGALTEDTVKSYYGEKRFEQVAESNAIEGSTLSVGETELAVLKGITITGHDPAFIRDAISLDKALLRLADMAKDDTPTNISQLHELHGLILGDRPDSGVFRSQPVRIKGSAHSPPKTWNEIMNNMEDWQQWSINKNQQLPAPIRAAVLHAWLANIHPFIDGNGRSSRAITNLELVRSGYPPIIIKKKERDRYIEALSESDIGGDIRSFIELIIEKIDGALTGLELSAKKQQGYSPGIEKIKQQQEQYRQIFETSVYLLIQITEHYLGGLLDRVNGRKYIKIFESPLDIETYQSLCIKNSISKSWAFIVNIEIPGYKKLEILAYFGFRSTMMYHHLNDIGGPSIYWSSKNPDGYPKWIENEKNSPYGIEITAQQGIGDRWIIRKKDNNFEEKTISELAKLIAEYLINLASKN